MTSDIQTLLRRHQRSGAVLDSNLLLLMVVGGVNETLVEMHRRTSSFTVDDFRLLRRMLTGFRLILTTPNVLTELSNLSRQVGEPWRTTLAKRLATVIPQMRESYYRSDELVGFDEFPNVGLADCSLLMLGRKGRLVFTTDFEQYRILHTARCAAINFNQLREQEWN
jgi:hypothetical protein